MGDKITNFEDYKKKDTELKESEPRQDTSARVPGDETLTAMDIRIEDPENFFNEEEREEYIHERQKEKNRPAREERPAPKPERREEPRRIERPEPPMRREDLRREEPDEDYEDDYDEEYEEEEEGGINMDLVVRIASIITGVIILAFIAFAVKVKVIDKYFAKDPDEVQTSVSALALPEGFTATNDTVTVTGATILNIRSGPSTDSEVMGLVPEGDILKIIAVNKEGTWALVEVDGQQVYASMKYLKEN